MAGIFISYRRSETPILVGRIYDQLIQHFSEELVFRDVYSMPSGVNFHDYLTKKIETCNVFIVVIGQNWASSFKNDETEVDYVKMEIELALKTGVPIFPITISGGCMPPDIELPEAIRPIKKWNSQDVDSDRHFHTNMNQLIGRIKEFIKTKTLDGALNIDKGFIHTILNGHTFSKAKFYSAKQDDNCQWFGILNNYDVIRDNYLQIKNEVLDAFTTGTTSKVIAVVFGPGGCGKSTLLRRLALELESASDFNIVWVKDRQLENFVKKALPSIQADYENKFLVFIEDWYRLTANDQEIGKELLDTSQSVSNVRFVIGDRDINGMYYLLNLMKQENVFKIAEEENERIIQRIVSKNDEWQPAFDAISKFPQTYNAPLFLILFALAGVSESRIDSVDINYEDLNNTVKRIARYDLKRISDKNVGFAKALHYLSCIYKKHRLFISYSTFLEMVDFYNKSKEATTYYRNWNLKNEIFDKLKLYINVSDKEKGDKKNNLIQFNHDKLAESVLSEVQLEHWEPYDDIQKLKLLDIVLTNGDKYSASVLLDAFLRNEDQMFIDNQMKKSYIDYLLYERDNLTAPKYLNYLVKLNLRPNELYEYIEYLKTRELHPYILWKEYFNMADNAEAQIVAKEIFKTKDITTVHHELLSQAINIKGNDIEKEELARRILMSDQLLDIPYHYLVVAFKQKGNDVEKQLAAKRILSYQELFSLSNGTLSCAFKVPGNESEKQAAARKILLYKGIANLHFGIVSFAFNQDGNDAEKQWVAKNILLDDSIAQIQPRIVSRAFSHADDDAVKRSTAMQILQMPILEEDKYPARVIEALRFFSTQTNRYTIVNNVIQEIIHRYTTNPDSKIYKRLFYELMSVPLLQYEVWKRKSAQLLSSWQWKNRKKISLIIMAYHLDPSSVSKVCEQILLRWKEEVTKVNNCPVGSNYTVNHILVALSHPDLRLLAFRTAVEIVSDEGKNLVKVPGPLLRVSKKMITHNVYPKW